ncbi:MAG TPA: XdhC family protein, partial [Planctomycetota bacterium]|nr:XdhC family protein [Planctomycetota bacterium]
EFANAERFPQASEIVVDAFDRGIARLPLGPNHHVLIATRGHKLDDEALLAAARSNAGWIGLLGSRRKAVLLFRRLYEAGVPEDRIRRMRAPVGLDLGGRRPEDIALSILAEITAEIHGASARDLSMMSDRVRAKIKGGIARDRAATGEATSAGEA